MRPTCLAMPSSPGLLAGRSGAVSLAPAAPAAGCAAAAAAAFVAARAASRSACLAAAACAACEAEGGQERGIQRTRSRVPQLGVRAAPELAGGWCCAGCCAGSNSGPTHRIACLLGILSVALAQGRGLRDGVVVAALHAAHARARRTTPA